MKRPLFALLLLLLATTLYAQNKKKGQPALPDISVEEALKQYNFSLAEQLLNQEIATLKRKKQPTIEQEEQLAWIRKAQIKLNVVERVAFIDSMVVPRDKVLNYIQLSPECGTLASYSSFFQTRDTLDRIVFRSQMGDKLFYTDADTTGNLSLYSRDYYSDGSASAPTLLAGISDDEEHQNYPYMMADGTTIYFAAQGPESLGGYDIFMSRYDAEERRFLAPENIGMPFNSPANDYLYIIDETYNLGWFVTDRNTPTDSVCIYVFIPNETRQVYVVEELEPDSLAQLARITRIQDTWQDNNAIRQAQAMLRQARSEQQGTATSDFDFIVTDNQVYHKRSDFRSAEARQMLDGWTHDTEELHKVQSTLTRLRSNYHDATPAQRETMKQEILTLEQREEQLTLSIRQQKNEIRKKELGI